MGIKIGDFSGSPMFILMPGIFLKKNRKLMISRIFATIFVCVAIGLLEIPLYYLVATNVEQVDLQIGRNRIQMNKKKI